MMHTLVYPPHSLKKLPKGEDHPSHPTHMLLCKKVDNQSHQEVRPSHEPNHADDLASLNQRSYHIHIHRHHVSSNKIDAKAPKQ